MDLALPELKSALAEYYRRLSFLPLVALAAHTYDGLMRMKNEVTRVPAADSPTALAHFEARLGFETDCWDVHAALALDDPGFVLLDVRTEELYDQGHVDGALQLSRWKITPDRLAAYPPDTLFVVYCAGPHCNGAYRAAIHLARLGRPVKEMIGGVEGWKDEGYELVSS